MNRDGSSKTEETRLTLEKTLKAIQLLNATIIDYNNQKAGALLEIQALEIRLKEAQRSLLTLQDNIGTTERSIAHLDGVVLSLRAALSPMKKMPTELLMRIFQLSTQAEPDPHFVKWRCPPQKDIAFPLILASVCSRWRSIVMSTSSIWSFLLVRMENIASAPPEREFKQFPHWMEACPRSRQHLALINWNLERHIRAITLLPSQSRLWKSIFILVWQAADGEWDLEHFHASEVQIYRKKPHSIQYFIPLMRQAKKLSICGPAPSWGTLPWISLMSLILKPFASPGPHHPLAFTKHSFVDLLLAAPRLTALVLDFTIEESPPDNQNNSLVRHGKLEEISFHLQHCVANGRLFGVHLDTPSLQQVTLLSLKRPSAVDIKSFYCMWEAPKCLIFSRLEDHRLLEAATLVRWYPRVETLQVEGSNIDSLFIFMHTLFLHIPPLSDPLPLPQLTSLVITSTDVKGETLIDLVENRLRHVQAQTPNIRPITRITMYDSPGVTPSHWSRIQELLEEGRRSLETRTGDDMEGQG